MADESPNDLKKLSAAERRPLVIRMRTAGASVRRIAAHFGISPAQVIKDTKKGMAELADELHASADEYRTAIITRAEARISWLWDRAKAGDLKAMTEMRKTDAELARLTGAYAPAFSPGPPPQEKAEDIDQAAELAAWRAEASARRAEAESMMADYERAIAEAPTLAGDGKAEKAARP